ERAAGGGRARLDQGGVAVGRRPAPGDDRGARFGPGGGSRDPQPHLRAVLLYEDQRQRTRPGPGQEDRRGPRGRRVPRERWPRRNAGDPLAPGRGRGRAGGGTLDRRGRPPGAQALAIDGATTPSEQTGGCFALLPGLWDSFTWGRTMGQSVARGRQRRLPMCSESASLGTVPTIRARASDPIRSFIFPPWQKLTARGGSFT